ncbi:MAG TPA: glycoside hydrolase family 30 beta sandwich domain-containing protein [Acidobacteriaceae bacterium]|jgi:glucosylceramidase|nr:glycoside hydrolase family 30 beta sandwich domain-containing protein [Acidobacteriaceae bacterium]
MKSRFLLAGPLALLLVSFAVAQSQEPTSAQLWLSTVNRSAVLALQSTPVRFTESSTTDRTITVNDMEQYQSMEGFGFAVTGGSAELLMRMSPPARAALLRETFSPTGDGIHASYIRVSIGSSDMNDHPYTYDDVPAGETDPQLAHFSLAVDQSTVIPVLKQILSIDPEIKILGSPWSAPAWMKTNDNLRGGHLKPEDYQVYAQYFVKYIEGMQAEGIHLSAITIQNEPLNPKNTPSMAMFATEEDRFIADDLGPAFARAGIHTGIQVYDHNPDVPSYPLSILADPNANKYVEGTAFHLYGGAADAFTKVHNLYPRKDLFMTEQSVTEGPRSTGLDIAEPVDRVLIGSTRNWSRNVLLWNLAANPEAGPHTNNGGCTGCWGALTLNGDQVTRNVAWYALGHFSKFVPQGSIRVGTNDLEQLDNVAFLTPQGKVVLVVSNTGNFPFDFAISYHGKIARTSLPPESVGTYVW